MSRCAAEVQSVKASALRDRERLQAQLAAQDKRLAAAEAATSSMQVDSLQLAESPLAKGFKCKENGGKGGCVFRQR